MFEHITLDIILLLMLYAVGATVSAVACVYLLLRRGNAFTRRISTPKRLRRWTAAFFGILTAGHLWYLPGTMMADGDAAALWMLIGALLDCMLTMPLALVVMLCMLQDRKRPLWIAWLITAPLIILSAVSVGMRSYALVQWMQGYFLLMAVGFTAYMVRQVRQYGRWLRDNYADLEHKEVWQSLLGLLCLILAFATYIVNLGSQFMEYLVQVETLFIVGFLTWRVDTIQQLSVGDEEFGPVRCAAGSQGLTSGGEDDTLIRSRLQEYCETTKLYLQHDLSLAQLSQAVGVDRADLSRYFARQGFTYNAYINRLRIDHFALLYREAVARQRPVTAQQLAFQCGFSSYSTFGVAFKQFMGQTAKSWMNNVQ